MLDFHDDFDEFMDRDSDVAAASSTSHNITDWEVGVARLSQHNILQLTFCSYQLSLFSHDKS